MECKGSVIDIVDDDESVCRALKRQLRVHGMDAESYLSGRLLLDSLSTRTPVCILLDVQMPGLSGLEVQEQLIRKGATFAVVFMTAHDDETMRQLATDRGAKAFLIKPFSDKALMETIQRVLQTPPDTRQEPGETKQPGNAGT